MSRALATATASVERLRERIERARRELDAELRVEVAQARARGATWEEIGRALRTSKQAAHHRFGGR